MLTAREIFLSLICGLPYPKRDERLFCMLTGYFDGSTQDGQALIFAGYVGRGDAWLRFSDEWENLLPKSPRRPFKMSIAAKTAKGMRRAKSHYELIARTRIVAIGCAIPIEPLRKVVRELGIDPAFANPFHFAWRTIISATFEGAKVFGVSSDEPVKFIFDDQTDKEKVRRYWSYYVDSAPRYIRKRIVGDLQFEPDDYLNPLQAADLVAWWARKQYIAGKDEMAKIFPADWTGGKKPNLYFVNMPEEGIRTQFARDIEAARRKKSELRMSASYYFPSWPGLFS